MSDDRTSADSSSPVSAGRCIGIFTTDERLVVTSWDHGLAAMTGIAGEDAVGRLLTVVVPDLESRGLIGIVRETLSTGSTTVLAPALHHYFIPAAPLNRSSQYDRMQQRVALAALMESGRPAGLVATIEDVTERLELEHQLAADLRAGDASTRLRTIERLAALNPVDGLGPLPAAMADDDWQVRRSAVTALAARRDPDLVDALVSALREGHRNFSVLSSALQLLSITGVDLTASLIDLLDHPDADLRTQAALALGTQSGPAAVDALLRALDDEDANVRFHAIDALGKLHPPAAVERLARIAESGDFFLAFPALESLSHINDPAVAPRIAPLLEDELVGDQAAEVLGQIGDEEAVAPLAAALDLPHLSPASVAGALIAIHARYDDLFTGGSAYIEGLVRESISTLGGQRVIDAAQRTTGASLRHLATLLGWLNGDAVERALAKLIGMPGALGELLEAIVRFGEPMVDRLIEQLRADDPEIRRTAATALGRIGDARAVDALAALLEEEDRELVVAAAGALAQIGDRRAFEPLLRLIGHRDLRVRQAAIGALNSIGHPDMSVRLRPLLEDSDVNVRESAVRIAGYFGYASCADTLLDRCRDSSEAVRAAALEHIGYLDDERSTAVLTSALQQDTPRARAAAARALGHVSNTASVEALRHAIRDPDRWVRYFGATSLGRLADRASLPQLERLAAEDGAPHVRIAAIGAIGEIGVGSDDDALTMLAGFSEAADDELAVAAIQALGSVASAGALDALRRALTAAQPARRAAAAAAIARRNSSPAIELLEWTAAADAEPEVMRAAIAGLVRIGAGTAPTAPQAVAALTAVAVDPTRRADAIAALAKLPEPAIPYLGAMLGSGDATVRRAAVEALGRLAHPTASAYVVTALGDDDASVRQLTVTVLARLGTRGVTRPLADLADRDPSESVRRAAAAALQRMGAERSDAADSTDRP